MQNVRSDIVVKVDTKNKGLTFECRLNAVNFIFLRQFVHKWSAALDLQEQNTQVFLVSFGERWHFIPEEKGSSIAFTVTL